MNHNTKKSFLYQSHDSKKAVIIYYSIVIAVYVATFITTAISISTYTNTTGNYGFSMNGIGFSTAIFLFCACAFKENFLMLMQNSISRKSVYLGRILNSLVLSFTLAAFDMIIRNIFGIIATLIDDHFFFESIFDMMYNGYCENKNFMILFLTGFLFFFTFFLFFHTLGYLMSTVFYRLSKTAKAFFAAGIPIFMFVVFPIIDNRFFGGDIFINLMRLLPKILGINIQNPFIGILSLTVGAILFTVLSWLPIRRARVE